MHHVPPYKPLIYATLTDTKLVYDRHVGHYVVGSTSHKIVVYDSIDELIKVCGAEVLYWSNYSSILTEFGDPISSLAPTTSKKRPLRFPSFHFRRRSGRYYRAPKTTNERRQLHNPDLTDYSIKVRGTRAKLLPDSYDDLRIDRSNNNWKRYRKTQYKKSK